MAGDQLCHLPHSERILYHGTTETVSQSHVYPRHYQDRQSNQPALNK